MIFKLKLLFTSCIICLFTILSIAQDLEQDWHLLDLKKDKAPGISLKQAYDLLKKNKKSASPVIVAVLDSGLDINHEDLNAKIWVNNDELKNNGLDDDKNGYIDDIHGWNFIGNSNGESLEAETLGLTRLYRDYRKKFKNKNKFNIQANEVDEYNKYLVIMKEYNEEFNELKERLADNKDEYEFFDKIIPPLQVALKKPVFTRNQLRNYSGGGQQLQNYKANFLRILDRNKDKDLTSEKLIKHYVDLKERVEELKTRLKYNYDLEFDGRKLIGDNYQDLNQKNYGNADVTKRSGHGTHVSGIIGAINNNKTGMNGIAEEVIIMPIRNTPMGDERDKDVANGIRYGVDNGAKIINMSFGKSYSANKLIVDEAIRYAQEKGVLLIHAAGNDHKNTDYYYNYPSPLLNDGKIASNWIEVGASSSSYDEKLVAKFSNYGNESVDIFAPGVDIYSTLPENKYDTRSGTSMAAPVVSGVAALLLSYFPELTPEEVKEIIVESGTVYNGEVNLPGTEDKVPFGSLSKSGKIINAYNAVKLALEKYSD